MQLLEFKLQLKNPLRQATLVFLVDENRVLLAMKKRGFGAGRWNGVGGKINHDETTEAAAIRETTEEIGVTPLSLELCAKLNLYFLAEPLEKDWNQQVVVYKCNKWKGDPSESEEMAPKWFDKTSLPFADMWPDDPDWLPLVLAGNLLIADFAFAKDGSISEFNVKKGYENLVINTGSPDGDSRLG